MVSKMHTSTSLLSFLLLPLAVAIDGSVPVSNTRQHLSSPPKVLQRPISFIPPSQHPISNYLPTTDEPSLTTGIVNILSLRPTPIPVNYSVSPQLCTPLISKLPHIFYDLSQRLLFENLEGIPFPLSDDSETSPLPIYLGANITEEMYRSRYVLSLSLKLSPLESSMKELGTPEWRSIVWLLERSFSKLDNTAMGTDKPGLGSVLVLEAEIEQVHILAELRLWRVIDGLPFLCES